MTISVDNNQVLDGVLSTTQPSRVTSSPFIAWPQLPYSFRLPLVGLLILVNFLWVAQSQAQGSYSAGGWSTLHQGPGNRKQVNNVQLAENYDSTIVLEGSSILTAPVVSPDGRQFVVTTGKGAGHSNLHAFTIDGEHLWSADKLNGDQGVDGCAILSSPIIDTAGDIYISDCDQLWAFKPDGRVKWVIAHPKPPTDAWQPSQHHTVNAYTTAVFTNQGHVMGVTNFGDVVVHDRATGAVLNKPFMLTGLIPLPTKSPLPDPMLTGLMDSQLRIWAWQLLMGGAMPSTNTPAVDLHTGRVFVAATSTLPSKGALVGLDVISTKDGGVDIKTAWIAQMGPGSGSSPSLSPDGGQVYVSDEDGVLYAISTRNGEVLWALQTSSAAASVAVGPDGTVYSLQRDAPAIIAVSAAGERLWESDVSRLVNKNLPTHWLLGKPVGSGIGNPTITNEGLLVPIAYGYIFNIGSRSIPLYVKSSVVLFDVKTGKAIRDVVDLPDDSSGITVVLADGRILNSLGALSTSSIAPIRKFLNLMIPADYELLEVTAGLNIASPAAK